MQCGADSVRRVIHDDVRRVLRVIGRIHGKYPRPHQNGHPGIALRTGPRYVARRVIPHHIYGAEVCSSLWVASVAVAFWYKAQLLALLRKQLLSKRVRRSVGLPKVIVLELPPRHLSHDQEFPDAHILATMHSHLHPNSWHALHHAQLLCQPTPGESHHSHL